MSDRKVRIPDEVRDRRREPAWRVPNDTRARELLAWTPTTTVRDGRTRTSSWTRTDPRLGIPDSGAAAA